VLPRRLLLLVTVGAMAWLAGSDASGAGPKVLTQCTDAERYRGLAR
jgi:hypothetical protein